MGRKQIVNLLENGTVIFKHPVKAYYSVGEGCLVVSVPKRNFKRAVKRNLLKRRIREAYRLNREILGDRTFDLMFIYHGNEIAPYETISGNVIAILKKIADTVADRAD